MQQLSIMALFCEDIRQEVGETITLVGIIPDNLNVKNAANANMQSGLSDTPVFDKVLSKLCIYARVNFDPDYDIGVPSLRLVGVRDEPIELGEAGLDMVEKTRAEAKAKGNLYAGIVFQLALQQFRFPNKSGTLIAEILIHGKAYAAGALTFNVAETVTASSAEH